MAYREPGVTVTQEFANAQPALATFSLPNVIVGPIFQIVTEAEAGTYSGDSDTYGWAGKLAGAIADVRDARTTPEGLIDMPAMVGFKSAIVQILEGSAGAVGTDLNLFTDATSGAFADVEADDLLVIGAGDLAGTYTVREKIDSNTIKIKETFASGSLSDIAYEIRRDIGDVEVDSAHLTLDQTDGVTLAAGIELEVGDLGDCPVVSATVVLTYRALRLENSSSVKEYSTIAALQADFGLDQIVPENPVVFGAYLALSNSVTSTNILGLGMLAMEDEALAYQAAFDVLALTEMYAISVMTQSTAVHTALKSHVEGLSAPSRKLERVGLVNRALVTTSTVVAETTTGGSSGLSSDGLTLTCPTGSFVTDGVVPGHFVVISAPSGKAGRYEVASVTSQTVLVLADAAPSGAATGVEFLIERDLTKTEQASVMAAYARSLGSRRLVVTFPDIVKIPVGNTIRELPGYFLNCAVGALTTGLPTQQGLTNLSVSLYSGVVHSTRYFDATQLNALADGGVMIFVQDVLDQTALYVRHQLTTDRTAVKFQEYSITKNVDFIAKFIRTNHRQYIGQYNIVDGTFDDLKTNAKGILNYLTERTRLPKIGGVIRGGKLTKILQDTSNIDAIIEQYVLDIPIPLNNLDITIVV